MTVLLAGDTGGTKTILRLVTAETGNTKTGAVLNTLYESEYRSADFPDLVPMVRQFLATAGDKLGEVPAPEKACFAIAGPVVGDTSKLTNIGWSLEVPRLSQALEIPQIALINDFAAVGYGVLVLEDSDIHTLQVGKPDHNAPIATIGAGTGLGQGFVINKGGEYQVFSTEGGHSDFAPRSELEFQLSRYLLEKHNLERVSVERVVSGLGIVSIYQFLRDRQFAAESPEVGDLIREWERQMGRSGKSVDPGAIIGKAALEKSDVLAVETMRLFIESYGAEAGNLALKLLPYGGLYIAGGIAAKVLPLMQDGRFLSAFIDKGRMLPLLQMVPVHIVLNPKVGLLGAALRASKLEG